MGAGRISVLIFFFTLMWVAINLLVARITGWAALAGSYRASGNFISKKKRCNQSARMRWMSRYRNCLLIDGNERGLYLAVMAFFRPGHPPLFIPWRDITIRTTESSEFVEFRFNKFPSVFLITYKSAVQRFAKV